MALDPVKNFAKVDVSTGYDASATSVVLSSGEGAKLPNPSVDGAFNITWWNVTDYADPSDDPNVEIVRVTARSTDTLTVTRAQEGTVASAKNVLGKEYKMVLAPTKKTIDDIGSNLGVFRRTIGLTIFGSGNDVSTGNGTSFITIPATLEGGYLSYAMASVGQVGTGSGTIDIQVRRSRAGTDVDMLSTKVTVSPSEYFASDGIIDVANRGVSEGDNIFVDVDSVTSTPPKGLSVSLGFEQRGASKKVVGISITPSSENVLVSNGLFAYSIPADFGGLDLTGVVASVYVAGSGSGTTDIQVRRSRSGTNADMLSTKVTIGTTDYTASDGVVDTANDDVQEGDLIYIDVDSVASTAPQGLSVTLTFE